MERCVSCQNRNEPASQRENIWSRVPRYPRNWSVMSKIKDAKIVIIGGGAVGCGTAYQLAQAGETDILVIEKEPSVAAVTSAQAAGLVGQVRTSMERTQLAMWSVKTFSDLQKDEKSNPSWRQVG